MKNKKSNIKIYGIIALILVVAIILALVFKGNVEKKHSPKGLTESYIDKYIDLNKEVVNNIKYPFEDSLSDLQFERYKGIIKNKYEKIEYSIVDDETVINEEDAIVVVTVNIVDIKAAYEKADTYISSHKEEFDSLEKEIEFKLDSISKAVDREEYTITFNFYKDDNDKWAMMDPSDADISKIEGLF